MADRAGLGFLGIVFGGITAVVMLVAATVVISDAGASIDRPPVSVVSAR